ncbi:asparagine synthase (glutamine-hydrolyzing) [Azonexus sp. IMCC34842]|uniref:asparagine synthase (glutamine-hydrolyzing) n=1 Tax=Azonexus sp. IMCC34842 TaxID=3420950 RepID=UPI003D0F9CC9
MCGIYGIINLDGSLADPELMERMGDITRHRGPDDQGWHQDGNCIIGMRRLSIIDLAGGHQPLSNEDGTIWLVCNGEIYNFRELREELKTAGHQFRSGSDCEVLLHAYEAWGDDFALRLNGMYNFALWDAGRRRLLIGRDRIGVKPLYWRLDGKRLAFATEAKALLALPGVTAAVDRTALASYLNLGYVSAPRSMFEGIAKLPVATLMSIEHGEFTTRRYWSLPERVEQGVSEGEWIDRIGRGIDRAVRMQMVSDVPIGAFLSGGVDSSAVVACMASATSQPVKTYAIGFGGSAADNFYNELPYARRVAELFATDHHEIVVKPDVVALLPRLLWHMDEPIADTAFITTYLVSEFARKDVTVILSGVGGDELFGGYRRYLGNHYAERFTRLPALLQSAAKSIGRMLPADRHSKWLNVARLAKGFLATAELSFEERYRAYLQIMDRSLAGRLLIGGSASAWDPLVDAFAGCRQDDPCNHMLAVDMASQLPDDLLMLTDKMSMTVSLECRVPLLDHELLEMAATMPEAVKIKGGVLKAAMKQALGGQLPPDILHRKKRGFGTPMGAWLKGELGRLLDRILAPESIRARGLFDANVVSQLVADHRANRQDYTDALIALLNFEIWARVYLDCRSTEDVTSELQEMLA